jgi:dienelactone hydrolase
MSAKWLNRTALLTAAFGILTGCAAAAEPQSSSDETASDTDEVGALLAGDGSEFEAAADVAIADEEFPVLAQQAGAADLNRNGAHRVGSYRSGFRNGPSFGGATIYYPTDVEGNLGGVVMCPGFTARQSSIAAWGPFFASHGIVLMTIDTNTVADPVPTRARALMDALASLKAENTRTGSPLRGKLSADKFGLSGWSMGGGGTWIATAQNPTLKTGVTLAGHNATGGGAGVSRASKVPTLMMNGASDVTILGGLGQSSGAYNAIPATTPKILYEMSGEGHFSWGTPRTKGGASGRYMMAWQKVYLEGEEQYKSILRVRGPSAAAWRSNVQ